MKSLYEFVGKVIIGYVLFQFAAAAIAFFSIIVTAPWTEEGNELLIVIPILVVSCLVYWLVGNRLWMMVKRSDGKRKDGE